MNQHDLYMKIFNMKEELGGLIKEHWQLYSNMGTGYFWLNLATVIVPLIAWLFLVDRKRVFEIAFFGFFTHVLWYMIDSFLTSGNYFNHPHSLFYLLPQGISVSAVLFPVVFMLLYQYCTNHKKSFWIYSVIGCFLFAYGYGLLMISIDMVRLHKGMNLLYLSLIDVAVVFIAYVMTLLFLKLRQKG
ncbi:hypothetical protein [Virgibacillus siamensis]|uniref:hypothetical protein n=1 Tax=Virgibacillus siamensis TaxID=480071 RepID=UPI0009874181|nr:hypothetical protein [Virgibacillus siamensis]